MQLLIGEYMKKIWMDFNEPDMANFRISKSEVEFFNLKISERIIFYTEDIQVEAIVFYESETDQWFGRIDSEFIDVEHEIVEAREDGFLNGQWFGEYFYRNEIIRNMINNKISNELIIKITKIDEEELINWFTFPKI
jgi:hypothetical protein